MVGLWQLEWEYKQNQYKISMSRVLGLYSPVNPDRVNPEFIGIGQKYSEHKRNRLDSDKYRKNIQSNFAFTLKLNDQLQRSLQSKQKQLQRLQAARKRHHNDINFKMSQEQRKQKQLQQLRQKSKQQRISIKRGIKNVQDNLKSQRLANKISTKEDLHEMNMMYKAENQAYLNQKCMKHKSVEIGKKIGNQRINEYYRFKNMQSYNNYLKRIDEQDQRSDENLQNIKKMTSKMKKLQKKIQKKQDKLKQVLEQINMYTVECQNQRKVNFLATVSAFRPSSTTSSWRSKPTEVLRTSFNKSKIQQSI